MLLSMEGYKLAHDYTVTDDNSTRGPYVAKLSDTTIGPDFKPLTQQGKMTCTRNYAVCANLGPSADTNTFLGVTIQRYIRFEGRVLTNLKPRLSPNPDPRADKDRASKLE